MAMTFRFREFELNLRAEVLTKSGVRVRLASQPLKLLALLVRRTGDLVTREEIRTELWPQGSVVDFDHLVNQYIRQLRAALGDNRESPLYIETAPRRGYRFIADVEQHRIHEDERGLPGHSISTTDDIAAVPDAARGVAAWSSLSRSSRVMLLSAVAVLTAAAALIAVFYRTELLADRSQRARAIESQQVAAVPTPVPGSLASAARAAYIKGKYFFDQSTQEAYQKSCSYFQQALDADPSYALAYKGMADCYMALSSAGLATADEAMPKAKTMARRAIELDDTLAEGHMALGVVYLNYDWDWPAAREQLERATQLAPASVDAHFALASYHRVVGQVDAAVRELKWAQALDPVSAKSYYLLGWLYVYAGRYEEAVVELQKCVELAPDHTYAHFGLFMAYDHTGRQVQAMSALQRYLALQKETETAAKVAQMFGSAGYARARRYYLELTAAAYVQRHFLSYQIAAEYALLGDKQRALDYLEQAYRERSNHMIHMKVHSYFDVVRNEPRFEQLLRQMRLADDQLAQLATVATAAP